MINNIEWKFNKNLWKPLKKKSGVCLFWLFWGHKMPNKLLFSSYMDFQCYGEFFLLKILLTLFVYLIRNCQYLSHDTIKYVGS